MLLRHPSSHSPDHRSTPVTAVLPTTPSDQSVVNLTAKRLRLNKFLAVTKNYSRRAADAVITQGRVTVNDIVAHLGVTVDPTIDHIVLDGCPVVSYQSVIEHLYLALHKPPRVMTTTHDPQGRVTVIDLLPSNLRCRRPFPVGRLDYLSEGLLLITTDGELALRLAHPRWHLPKCYHVWVRGPVPPGYLATIATGMTLAEGNKLAPINVRILTYPSPPAPRHLPSNAICLEFTLTQGINRQIRRICRDLSLPVFCLIRIAQGPVSLDSLLPSHCVHLTPAQLTALRAAVGLA